MVPAVVPGLLYASSISSNSPHNVALSGELSYGHGVPVVLDVNGSSGVVPAPDKYI